MSQQINLLNPALIQKTDFLNPNTIGLLLGVLLLGLIAYYQYESNALAKLNATHAQRSAEVAEMETHMIQIRAAKAAQPGNQVLLDTIHTLEQKKIMQEAIIKAVSQNNSDQSNSQSSKSYAALLKAFSKQSIDGLWITGLSIDQDAEALSIKGRALHADLLPALIARLRAEPALKGKTFTDLKMQSASFAQINPASTATQTESATNTKIAATPTLEKKNTPTYIEFTLHSVTEKGTNKANILATPEASTTVGAVH